MCLAVPGQVLETDGQTALVDILGNRRRVAVSLVNVAPGQWVLVHAGLAIEVLDEAEAAKTVAAYRMVMGNG